MKAKFALGTAVILAMLAACSQPDVHLPGERLSLRDGLPGAETAVEANRAQPLRLPAAQMNASWTQRGGSAQHRITQPALAANLTQVFAVPVGDGNSRRARITAEPVVENGRVFTLDARGHVAATSTEGAALWATDLTTTVTGAGDASGGGLAVAGARLFVTTGFGTISALDVTTGAIVWTQDLQAPGTSAVAVYRDLVYVMSRDSRAWAIDAGNGRVVWQIAGTPSTANFAGGAGPAVGGGYVVFPFSSGEVMAAFPNGGLRRWVSVVSGQRLETSASNISDIAADPVIDGSRVYVGNYSGRLGALDLATGERIWTANEGATGPVWPAGGSLFAVNDLNELIRVSDSDGSVIWRVALPNFVKDNPKRRRAVYAHFGPVLAGGRLIVASSDGYLRSFDPVSGALIGETALPDGAASAPVVAGGVLYVLSEKGELLAFR